MWFFSGVVCKNEFFCGKFGELLFFMLLMLILYLVGFIIGEIVLVLVLFEGFCFFCMICWLWIELL